MESCSIYIKLILEFAVSFSQAVELQTLYMELLTMSGDYNKFLGQLHKNMEELKVLMLYHVALCLVEDLLYLLSYTKLWEKLAI